MKALYGIALALVIVGAINWGLVGLFDLNLVAALFGVDSFLSNLVYILVGVSGLISLGIFGRLKDTAEATTHDRTATRPHDAVDTHPVTARDRAMPATDPAYRPGNAADPERRIN